MCHLYSRSLTFYRVMFLHYFLHLFICIQLVTSQQGLGVYFVTHPQSVVLSPGDTAVFTCATNIDVDHLSWQHGWNTLESGRDVNIVVQHGRLQIHLSTDPAVYKLQTGLYRCMAWMVPIGVTSLSASLTVAHLEPFSSDGVNKTELAAPGSSVSIHCPVPASTPPPLVSFYRDGQLVIPHGDSVVMIESVNNLHLSDLSSAVHGGYYSCSAYNSVTGQTQYSQFGTRLVVGSYQDQQSRGASFSSPPLSVYTAALNSTIRLECVSRGWPVPHVTWRRSDSRSSRRYVQYSASLQINRVALTDDNAVFECEAANSLSSVQAQITVKLLAAPQVTTTPSDMTVPEGQSVSVTCQVKGHPSPRLYWLLEGRPVKTSHNIQLTHHNTTLNIAGVQRHNAGLYQCFAVNSVSENSAATLLKVELKTETRHHVDSDGKQRVSRRQQIVKDSGTHSSTHYDEDYDDSDVISGVMVTPSAPQLFQMSDTAVMLSWNMDSRDYHSQTEPLAVLFFKIQYRRMPARRYDWSTLDNDISASARSYKVDELEPLAKYKFRVLAVYANKDNRNGPNSPKLKMLKMRPSLRPSTPPTNLTAITRDSSSVTVEWQYGDGGDILTEEHTTSSSTTVRQMAPSNNSSNVDGFFIYYRTTTSAGEYSMVNVAGAQIRSFIVDSLQSATVYDFKVQSYRTGGGVSPFSNIASARTRSVKVSSPAASTPESSSSSPDLVRSSVSVSRVRLYTVVASLLAVLTITALIIAATVYYCRTRTHKQGIEYVFGDREQQVSLQPLPCTADLDDLTSPQIDPPTGQTSLPSLPAKSKWKFVDGPSYMSPIAVSIPSPPSCHHHNTVTSSQVAMTTHHSPTLSSNSSCSATLSHSTNSTERRRKLRRKDSMEFQRHRRNKVANRNR